VGHGSIVGKRLKQQRAVGDLAEEMMLSYAVTWERVEACSLQLETAGSQVLTGWRRRNVCPWID